MYSCGSLVVYSIHGVCEIGAIEKKRVDGKQRDYYVLSPRQQSQTKFYVPCDNEAALKKMRPLLTKQQIEDMLQHGVEATWIPDENRRKLYYRELISKCDMEALICMVRALHIHKKSQAEAGKKFHLCDENFLRDAEKLISDEFSQVLGIPQNEVGSYIESVITG